MKIYRNKQLLILAGVALAVWLLFIPIHVNAGLFDLNIGDILLIVPRFILVVFNTIAGFFLSLAGSLVDVMLNINYLITSSEQNKLVEIGWGITRDIANLGFVLVIIVIAFATILRFREYGAKKLLPKLIAAAILVNFSFVIAGMVLNFSHVLANFFLRERLGYTEGGGISDTIATAFEPQKLTVESEVPTPPSPEEGGGFTIGASAIISIVSAVFSVIFTLLAALVFFALAIMLLIRFVMLSILLILAPIAWLLWVIPSLSSHFRNWWSQFFKWALFLPVVSFFIYLSLFSAKTLAESQKALVGSQFQDALKDIMVQGSQMFIIAALLMGGLIAANKLGIHGAGAAMKMAQGAGKTTQKWAARQAGRAGVGVGSAVGRRALTVGTKTDEKTGETTSLAERTVTRAARIPGIGRAFRGTAERVGKAKAGLAESVKERQEKLGNTTNAYVENMARTAINPINASAAAAELTKRGRTDKVSDEVLDKLMKGVQITGTAKDILPFRPDFAPRLGTTVAEAVKSIKAGKAEEIDKEALGDINVAINLSPAQLKRVSSHGSPEQRQAIVDALKKDASKLTEEERALNLKSVREFIEHNVSWQDEGTTRPRIVTP